MSDPRVMWPLQEWLAANGIPRPTYYYLKSKFPDQVPSVIALGKGNGRKYVTVQADAEYRARINSKLSNTGAAA